MRDDLRTIGSPTAENHTLDDERLDRTSLAEYLETRRAGALIKAVVDVSYTIEYGLEIDRQSCLAFLLFIHADRRSKFTPFGVYSDERFHVVEGNDKIATGTITQDKLAFTPGGTHYANVVVVAISGGDFTDPIAAVNSIVDASADKPYLVKIMPAKYDLLGASLHMKEFVDVEGSGPDNTIITSSNSNDDGGTCTVGTVLMANNSSTRHIKVVNSAPDLNGAYTSMMNS